MQRLTPYTEARLILWRRLQQETRGASLSEYFRPTAGELRFHLGTALADLRIPWRIDTGLHDIAANAAVDAFVIACLRHTSMMAPGEVDHVCAAAGNDGSGLRALTWTPPSSVTSANLVRTFTDAMAGHPGIDAGLVSSLLGTDRPGRMLLKALHSLFARARNESQQDSINEPTPWIVALGLRTLSERLQTLVRAAPVSENAGRWLRGLVGVLMYETTHLSLQESGIAKRAARADRDETTPEQQRAALLTLASLGVSPFIGARGSQMQTGVSVYGFSIDQQPPRLEETMVSLRKGEDVGNLSRNLAAVLTQREPEVMRRFERAVAVASVRDNLKALARLANIGRAPSLTVGDDTLARLLSAREGVERQFFNEQRRRALEKAARDAARQARHDEARHRLEALAHAAKEYRDDDPSAWLGVNDTRLAVAHGLVAFAVDQILEQHAASASAFMLERSGEETEGGGAAEYDTGRLYLLSHDDRPLLKARAGASQVGQLFCDMKDFTRRTALLKESVIADFLQREFYTPILQAASGLDPGSHAPSVQQNVVLNNLLGDAVSFSGDIVALVKLSRDIQRILRGYSRRLEHESSTETVAGRVRALETQHRTKRDALERSIQDLHTRAPTAAPAMRDAMVLRAKELSAEYVRREAAFEVERSRAAGEKLEAGTFISYGAAPEVAQFEDAVFGHIKVAIAEKINESARGTARSMSVRTSVDAHLERVCRLKKQTLTLPFQVVVGRPLSLQVPPDRALAASELMERGDIEGARNLITDAALLSLSASGPGEIYNAGAAMSEEALDAWVSASKDDLKILRLDKVSIASLNVELRRRFFFPTDPIRLVAGFAKKTGKLEELFVFQGRVLFKGFEATGGLGVWEIIDQGGELFRLLAKHHAAAWFADTA